MREVLVGITFVLVFVPVFVGLVIVGEVLAKTKPMVYQGITLAMMTCLLALLMADFVMRHL